MSCTIAATARAAGDVVASHDSRPASAARPRDRRFQWTVSALLALQLLAGGVWFSHRNVAVETVDSGLAAAAALCLVLEDARDQSGRVPESLATLSAPLPSDVAPLVREGRLRYRPNPDRTDFEVILLPAAERGTRIEDDEESSG
jgi:hypothetical protein